MAIPSPMGIFSSFYEDQLTYRLPRAKIIGATAQKVTIVAAGSTIIGFGAGMVFVSYPGIAELLPNKYR